MFSTQLLTEESSVTSSSNSISTHSISNECQKSDDSNSCIVFLDTNDDQEVQSRLKSYTGKRPTEKFRCCGNKKSQRSVARTMVDLLFYRCQRDSHRRTRIAPAGAMGEAENGTASFTRGLAEFMKGNNNTLPSSSKVHQTIDANAVIEKKSPVKRYCSDCQVWTDPEATHCHKCATCRVGNADDMYHCDTCDACFLKKYKDRHQCLKIPLREHSCSICLESIHFSQKRSNVLNCGHIAHYDCLVSYLSHHDSASKGSIVPNCPTCRKCLLSKEDARPFWDEMRQAIKQSPMPADWFGPVEVGDVLMTPEDGELAVTHLPSPLPLALDLDPASVIVTKKNEEEPKPTVASEDPIMTAIEILHSRLQGASRQRSSYRNSSIAPSPEPALSLPLSQHCVGVLSASSGIAASYPLASLTKAHHVEILCNDCEKRCTSNYHVMGLECGLCGGFNTARA